MALKIWGSDPEAQPKPRQRFADDVVGRFRSGHQLGGQPASLDEWRVTTGDPEVADKVYEILGGDAPATWETKSEDNLEVFTATPEVEIILADPKALRQRMVLWSRAGNGPGPSPQIEVYFRLAQEPDLGIFKYQTGSWSLASDLVRNETEEALEEIDGPTLATLAIEEVSFVAKNGPRKGQTVTYNKPVLTIKGAAPEAPAAE